MWSNVAVRDAHLTVRQTVEIRVVGDHGQDATAGLVDPILTPPQELDEVVFEVVLLFAQTRLVVSQLLEDPAAAVRPTKVRVGRVADDDGRAVCEQGPCVIDFVQDIATVRRPTRHELGLEQYLRGPATSRHDVDPDESSWQYVTGHSQPAPFVAVSLATFVDVFGHAEQEGAAAAGWINDLQRRIFAGQAARDVQLATQDHIHSADDEPHNRLWREVAAAPSSQSRVSEPTDFRTDRPRPAARTLVRKLPAT